MIVNLTKIPCYEECSADFLRFRDFECLLHW